MKTRFSHFRDFRNIGGFGIIEAVFATAILVGSVTLVVGGYIYAQQEAMNSSRRSQAILLATEAFEAVRDLTYQDFSAIAPGTYGLRVHNDEWDLTPTPDTTGDFIRTILVQSEDAYRKKITVTIDYGTKSISHITRITSWERDAPAGTCSSSAPTLAGSLTLQNDPTESKVQISGDYAYVVSANGDYDFLVIDISNPRNPIQVAQLALSGDPTNIHIHGNYAYVTGTGDNDELMIINITNPAVPVFLSSFSKEGTSESNGVFVVGNTAYLGSQGDTEFVLVDVSNPALPVQEGYLNISDHINEVTVSGNYAYAVTEKNPETTACVSTANIFYYIPTKPSTSGIYPTRGSTSDSTTLTTLGSYTEGSLWINLAFTAIPTGFRDAVLSIRFTDLDVVHRPIRSGNNWGFMREEFTLTDHNENILAQLIGIHPEPEITKGNQTTVCHNIFKNAKTLHVSINAVPALLSHPSYFGVCIDVDAVVYNDPDFDGDFTWIYDVDNALITGSTLTLKTYFLSHHELFYGSSITSTSTQDGMTEIKLCGTVTSPSDGELMVIDMTIANTPVVLTTLALTSGQGSADTIALDGSRVYVGQGSVFHVIDISDPASPTILDTINLGDQIMDIGLSNVCDGKFVPVATANNGSEFQLIDISNPYDISVAATLNLAENSILHSVAYHPSLDRVVGTKTLNESHELVVIAPN